MSPKGAAHFRTKPSSRDRCAAVAPPPCGAGGISGEFLKGAAPEEIIEERAALILVCAAGGVWRVALAFNPRRRAILLVAGGRHFKMRECLAQSRGCRITSGS